ncbi:nSTAND1 domain-containing NTPase [Terracidiphilus gabretensis]|uniref:nSTAND1 domain-containing NTPase n=1 Tax=Terracidiphilus gabretensis TaxID=1577687 RepID=UPI00071B6C2D|nr:CHAT domain-containing protein [Terracidiphilus gabretensis]
MSSTTPPVFFFTFADPDQQSDVALPSLQSEEAGIRSALASGEQAGSWEFVSGFHACRKNLFETFRNNRVAIFHFGGHSNQQSLWLPAETPGNQIVDGVLLEEFLVSQPSLQLAFFNSCENQEWAAKVATRVPFVIASVAKLDDVIAGHFAAAFYGYLATGSTLDDAFSQAAGDVMGTHQTSLGNWVDKYKQHPPQFRTFDEAEAFPTPAQATFPWVAVKRPGASSSGSWRLADVAHDPLVGLPPLAPGYYKDLPKQPYVTIKGHTKENAPLFFGRSTEIRAIADWALGACDPARPISLFYGQSGVGKSSLLNAGLLPRLPADCRYAYRRRNRNLIDDLYSAIAEVIASQPPAPGAPAPEATQDPAVRETQVRTWLSPPQRSLIILDQVEEAITHATTSGNSIDSELRAFANHVRQLFSQAPSNSSARLLLSFRKEYLAEIRGYFAEGSTDNSPDLLDHFWLDRLDHDAIVQVVTGPAYLRFADDQNKTIFPYKIVFPEGDRVPNLIADDLLKGDSSIATVLQIVLNQLWDATQPDANGIHSYTVELYENLAIRQNPLLGFYEQQLAELYGPAETKAAPQSKIKTEPGEIKAASQGLELDLLYAHTSELGTSRRRSLDDLKNDYANLGELGLSLDQLLTANIDKYLLTQPARDPGGMQTAIDNHSTALTHDTLAPLIRRDFALSELPGARARRLLENRGREWSGGRKGIVLDRADLRTVTRGLPHMRAVTPDEQRLIGHSRTARRRAFLRSFLLLLLLPVLAVGTLAIYVTRVHQQEQDTINLASNYASNSSNQVLAIAEGMESVRLQQGGAFWLRLNFLGAIKDTNKEIISNLQQALQFREVYRAQIDTSMVDLDQCAVALDQHDRPLVTSRNGTTLLGGNPVSALQDQSVCDPASGVIAQISADGWNLSVWRAGKTQTFRLADELAGPMAIQPGGTTIVYGSGAGSNPADKSIILVDLSTGQKIHQIQGVDTGNRVMLSPSGQYLVQDSNGTGLDYVNLSQPSPRAASLTGKNAMGRFVGVVGGQQVVAFGGKGFSPSEKMNPEFNDLQVYRLSDGKLLNYETGIYEGNSSWSGYEAVTLSPDGRMLASYSSISLGQIDLWAVPSTLDAAESGGMASVDPELKHMREDPENEGSPAHLASFSVPQGIWNIIGISPDLRYVTTAELEQIPADQNQSDSKQAKQAAFVHVWAIHSYTKKELQQIKFPVPLFDIGCKLIGTFIDDMAANPTMVSGTENIDYHALSASCKQRIKQEGVMTKATKAGDSISAPEKPKSTPAPSKPQTNSAPSKPESVTDAQRQLKTARQEARKAARQAAQQK